MNAAGCTSHPWTVTAPWYAWPRAGVPASGRGTAPLLQKFAGDDFIADFIGDPQHSLEFDADADQVYTSQFIAASPGQFAGKIAALFPVKDAKGTPLNKGEAVPANLRKSRLVGTGLRKLYLPSHARHYLVVCELHCDVPGLPPPAADTLCQAGFVVRRRRLNVGVAQQPAAVALLRTVVQAQALLSDLETVTPLRPALAQARAMRLARLAAQGRLDAERGAARQALAQARAALEDWQLRNGVRSFNEGWLPGTRPRIGSWCELADETPPQLLQEAWVRLQPLKPDPRDTAHAARGRALFFGLVPTGAFETTAHGDARFDDRSTYELRCFFRHHDCRCPHAGLNAHAPDCGGGLVWSAPTEAFRLAAPFDLLGTSHRPVTIQMPNLADLAAQAMARPIGQFSPVRLVQPQQLSSQTDGGIPTRGSLGGPAVCFISIPLITLVASFVLNLFLPIVVLLFNLWFLLALRFCVPPGFSIEGGLQAELAAIPSKPGVDAELAVDVDAAGFSLGGRSGAQIQLAMAGLLADTLSETTGIAKSKIEPELLKYSNAPLVALGNVLYDKAHAAVQPDGSVRGPVDLTQGQLWRVRRISQWKFEKFLPTTGEFA